MSAVKDYASRIGPGYNPLLPGASAITQVTPTLTAVVPLTAAQIIAMYTTPVPVLPAPGTGQAIIVERITVELILTATQFASGGAVHFYYHGQTVEIMSATLAAASINAAAGTYIFDLLPVATAGGSVVTKEVGIDITNATGVFATGTGTAKLFIKYKIITL